MVVIQIQAQAAAYESIISPSNIIYPATATGIRYEPAAHRIGRALRRHLGSVAAAAGDLHGCWVFHSAEDGADSLSVSGSVGAAAELFCSGSVPWLISATRVGVMGEDQG